MKRVFSVSATDICSLDGSELQVLANKLLLAEAMEWKIPLRGIDATSPAQITTGDGGQDARISWQGGVEQTNFIPSRDTVFQVKAKNMTEATCRECVLAPSKNRLLPMVEDVLNRGGSYVILCNQNVPSGKIAVRRRGIRDGLSIGGRLDSAAASVDFYDANKLSDWANLYPAIVAWIRSRRGVPTSPSVQAWEEWQGNPDVSRSPFIADDAVKAQLTDLRRRIAEPRCICRIVGMSGCGKTRLVFEALKATADQDGARAIQDSVLYIESGDVGTAAYDVAVCLRNERLPATLVVDDCPPSLHTNLVGIAQHSDSRFRLFTLDFDPASTGGTLDVVRVNRASDVVINGILAGTFVSMRPEQIDQIVRFADGFPRIAVELGRSSIEMKAGGIELTDSVLVEKLLWGRSQRNSSAKRVIGICSAFEHLGCEAEVAHQLRTAADICGVPIEQFWEHVVEFQSRQIIQKRNRFIRVEPLPLALRLAADWWRALPPGRSEELLSSLPADMAKSMCEQLRLLDHLAEAKSLASKLCGIDGPFGSAKALNTEVGTLCFRALADVSPDTALRTLSQVIESLSLADLRKMEVGRRNLVWTLEKLVFRREFFKVAAVQLLRLAAAENESWGNNATGQFFQLFHAFLSGTEATVRERMEVLDIALSSNEPEYRALGLMALGHVLRTSHFTRTLGAELQGSGIPRQDNSPSTEELLWYWREGLDRLTTLAVSNSELEEGARRQFASSVRDLVRRGMTLQIVDSVDKILSGGRTSWPDALEAVVETLRYDGGSFDNSTRDRLERLRDRLTPTDLEARIRLYVSQAPWGLFAMDEVGGGGARESIAQSLAEEVLASEGMIETLAIALSTGQQLNAYAFGKRVGELVRDGRAILDAYLSALLECDGNPTVLCGLVSGVALNSPGIAQEFLDRVAANSRSARYLPLLTSGIEGSDRDLIRIAEAVSRGEVPVNEVRILGSGQVLSGVGAQAIGKLVLALGRLGQDGVLSALDVTSMYCHGSEERKEALEGVLSRLILAVTFESSDSWPRGSLDTHHLKVLATWLIARPNRTGFAQKLVAKIFRATLGRRPSFDMLHEMRQVVAEALRWHTKVTLVEIAKVIRGHADMYRLVLSGVCGDSTKRGRGANLEPLDMVPRDALMEWCRSVPNAPVFLARLVEPIETSDDGNLHWTPTMQSIIDEFASKDVLSEISANIGTYAWTGSLVSYWKRYEKPLSDLLNHRNELVRAWSQSQLHEIKQTIERESGRDAERDFGIW